MNSLLEELLHDQNERWQRNEVCTIETLLANRSIPLDSLSVNDLLDLVCNEVRLREAAAQTPTLEEYQQLFPQIHEELSTQWQVNVLLDNNTQHHKESQSVASLDGFGRYEVFGEVGRGAMGIVYEAYDLQLRRIVAIKCLRSEFGRGSIEFERFENEAESIGKLNHPNLVQIYDFGFNKDVPYIVMEFCSGGTLADRLSEPMVSSEAVELLISIASAVGVAHSAGIIHRDLKPANILVLESNQWPVQVKVSDFGLAKSLDLGTSATLTNSILGSPAYMPPEQAAGDRQAIGPASDVYALGAILFQCLTARPPFVGDSIADVLYQVENNDPLLIRQLNPRTPRPLETIVAKCLSKHPSDRYANANELRDDLDRFRSGLAIRARPERLDQKLRRITRRHRLAVALISTSLMLLMGLVVSSLVYSGRMSVALTESKESAKLAILAKAEGLLAKANGHRVSNRPGRRLIAQDILREAIQIGRDLQQPDSWFRPYRDEAIETMWLSDLCVRHWKSFPQEISYADFSPSGRLACIVNADGNLQVREWDKDTVLAKGTLPTAAYLAFLDEERFIALADDTVSCYRVSENSIQREWDVAYPAKSKVGYWLDRKRQRLFVLVTDKLLLIDLESGKIVSETPSGNFQPSIDIAFHPQEEIYLISSYESSLMEIRTIDTHRVLFEEKFPESSGATGVAWNPDGSEFILFEGNGIWAKVYVWDGLQQTAALLKTIKPAENLPGPSAGIGGGVRVCWPENNLLLTHNWNGNWAIHDAEITHTFITSSSLHSSTNFSNLPQRFDRGNHRIAMVGSPIIGSKEAGPLEVALGNEQQRLIGQAVNPVFNLAINHDGKYAVCVVERRLWFLDLANGNTMGSVDLGILQLGSLALDGQDNLYVITPDYAAAIHLEFREDRIVLHSARRVPVPATNPYLSVSPDGRTLVAGAWAGYHSSRYAGIWVKTPDEPTSRKILQGQSGAMSSIDPLERSTLVFSGDQVYRVTLPKLEAIHLGPTTLSQSIQFSHNGAFAIAGGKLWQTSDWRSIELKNNNSDSSIIAGFSLDGTHIINASKGQTSQLRTFPENKPYLQLEDGIVHYDSQYGTMLCSRSDGLYFRDLRQSVEQLSEFGLRWEGPEFQEMKPLGLSSVELSPELANLKNYSQWMDYLDEQALNEASRRPDDGHAQFQAAMVYVERCEYEQALKLLQRCSQLLPNAITPFQWQAYVLAAQQRWGEAIDAATRFIDGCNDGEMLLQRAAWHLEVNQPQRAIEDADQVIAHNPNYYFPRRSWAIKLLAYEQLGDTENARKTQEEISIDRPTDDGYADSLESMVTAEILLRQSRLAACYARQILDPLNPDFASALAWSKLREGDYEAALNLCPSDLSQTAKDSPNFARWLALQVICHVNLGNSQIASERMAQLRVLEPTRCTDEWFSHAREIRLLIAEARQVLQQKSMPITDPTPIPK